MSFLDDALNSAKKVFDVVENKTVTTVEIQKLKIKALGIDAELRKIYEKLGKLYYKELKYREDVTEDIRDMLLEISEKKSEIELIREQIAAFKGGVACPECGNLNQETADYCANCGAEL